MLAAFMTTSLNSADCSIVFQVRDGVTGKAWLPDVDRHVAIQSTRAMLPCVDVETRLRSSGVLGRLPPKFTLYMYMYSPKKESHHYTICMVT